MVNYISSNIRFNTNLFYTLKQFHIWSLEKKNIYKITENKTKNFLSSFIVLCINQTNIIYSYFVNKLNDAI